MSDINTIFQEYLSVNADREPIDFSPLLQKYPQHKESLSKKIKAYQKLVGTLRDEKPEKESPLLVGREIGGCKLIKVLGQGGMGVAYLGRQEKLGRDVVVKVLRPFAVDNKVIKERFLRESRIIGRLNHKNIVPVYDVGEQEGSFYIIMRHVEGTPLNVLIEKFSKTDRSSDKLKEILNLEVKTPTEFLCNLIIQVADAIQYAHDNGIIHRDIKPSNIIVEPNGNPILLDFGLSHDEIETNMTVSGEFLGTPIYSAPELFKKEGGKNSPQLDVYALGVTLYELLTGALPYEGESIYEIYTNIKNKEPIRPKNKWHQIPRDLETIISTAISKEILLRYQTANALREDLQNLLHYLPIKAKSPSLIRRTFYFARRRKARLILGTAALTVLTISGLLVRDRLTRDSSLASERARALINEAIMKKAREEYEAAQELLNKAYNLDPNNLISLEEQVKIHEIKKEYDQALKKIDILISCKPTNELYIDTKAYIFYLMERLDEYINLENQLIENYPQKSLHHIHIITALDKMNRYEDILKHAEKGLDLEPDNHFLLSEAARACENIGNNGCAEKYYDQLTNGGTIETYYISSAANFFDKIGKKEKAIFIVDKAISTNPADPLLRRYKSLLIPKEGDKIEAIREATVATMLQPNNPEVWTWLGTLQSEAGSYEEAIKSYEKGINLGDNSTGTKSFLGSLYNTIGQYEKAEKILKMGFKNGLTPQDKRISGNERILGDIYRELCYSYYQRNLTQDALKMCKKSLETGGNIGLINRMLGLIFEKSGQYEIAEQYYFKSLAMNNTIAAVNLLELYTNTKQYSKYLQFYPKLKNIGGDVYLNKNYNFKIKVPFVSAFNEPNKIVQNLILLATFETPAIDPREKNSGAGISIYALPKAISVEQVFREIDLVNKNIYSVTLKEREIIEDIVEPYRSVVTNEKVTFNSQQRNIKRRIVIRNGVAIIILGHADSRFFDGYLKDFDKIFKSLEFTK